jgi:mRNA interferase RelE/StbE
MPRYALDYERQARKDLAAIRDRVLLSRIRVAIAGLAEEPRPHDVKKMAGTAGHWRVRVGDWRIVYRIEDGRLVVVIVAVAKRGAVYGRLVR